MLTDSWVLHQTGSEFHRRSLKPESRTAKNLIEKMQLKYIKSNVYLFIHSLIDHLRKSAWFKLSVYRSADILLTWLDEF